MRRRLPPLADGSIRGRAQHTPPRPREKRRADVTPRVYLIIRALAHDHASCRVAWGHGDCRAEIGAGRRGQATRATPACHRLHLLRYFHVAQALAPTNSPSTK